MAEWSTHKSSPSGDVFSVINQTFASSTGHGSVSRKKKRHFKMCYENQGTEIFMFWSCESELDFGRRSQSMVGMMAV